MLGHNDIIKKRSKYLAPSFSVSYDRPLHIVRGRGQYLYDSNGKEYLDAVNNICLLYTSPSPRDGLLSRMPSSA